MGNSTAKEEEEQQRILYFSLLPLDVKKHLIKRNYLCHELDVMWKWLLFNKKDEIVRYYQVPFHYALSQGYILIVQWFRKHGVKWDNEAVYSAVSGGRDCFLWCIANGAGSKMKGRVIAARAARKGQLEILQWCATQFTHDWVFKSEDVCIDAARGGHIEILKWLKENGTLFKELYAAFAASAGHLDVVKWFHSNGVRLTALTCTHAAQGGHIYILKWLKDNDIPWNHLVCSLAAAGGHFETLQWLRENGAPWSHDTASIAVRVERLDMLQWCKEQGVPWNLEELKRVARDPEIIKWLEKQEAEKQ